MVRKIFLYVTLSLILSASLTWAAENPAATAQPVLTLEKCLELAYVNNPQLKAATQTIVVAQATMHKAQGGFLPSLDYQLGMTNSSDPDTGLMTRSTATRSNTKVRSSRWQTLVQTPTAASSSSLTRPNRTWMVNTPSSGR